MRLFQRAAHRYLPRYREFLALERRQFDPSRPTRFIALSRFVADHMRRFFNVPADRIDVIPNGVDTDHFLPGDQPALRASWGWDDRTIFLLAAHNFALKGLRQAIEALGQLRRAGQAVGLIVLGQDRALPYIKQARRLGCASDVRFLGNRTDPVPYFQACDVYLQPTYYDPCSLVLLEALACGLPVVTTRQNGASELITAGVHGHIIDHPDDRHALARAMSDLVDPSVRRLAGHAARSLALRHTQERNSRSFIDIYRSLGPVRRAA
jgi:UDP-glucose:(heptosyl)LPS alpha-1,3-glucosyltransferase